MTNNDEQNLIPQHIDSKNEPTANKTRIFILISILLILVASLAYILLYGMYVKNDAVPEILNVPITLSEADLNKLWEQNERIAEADALYETGDFERAAEKYDEAARLTSNSVEKSAAQRMSAASSFFTGDFEKQKGAIDSYVEIIITSDAVPAIKSRAIGEVASLICGSGCSKDLFEYAFSKEPLTQYYVVNDIARSVAQLYEWSLLIYPVTYTQVRLMSWYSEQLLLSSDSLSDEQVTWYTNLIDLYDADLGRMYEQQQLQGRDQNIHYIRSDVSHYFWLGYSYGGPALVNYEKYGEKFESAYKKSIEIGSSYAPGSSVNYATLFAYYQYAAILHKIKGAERRDDVVLNLTKLMDDVRNDPTPDQNQFLLMAKNEFAEDGFQHGFIGESLYDLSRDFSEFKEFLAQFGIKES